MAQERLAVMSSENKDTDKSGVKERASFYSRDPRPFSTDTDDPETREYAGEERRKTDRRSNAERRQEIRFEPGKDDRRQDDGRRKDDKKPKFW